MSRFKQLSQRMRAEAIARYGRDSGYVGCYHDCEHFGLDGGAMRCAHPDAPDHGFIINHGELERGPPLRCPKRREATR
jgi:hypothetical protein